MRGAASLIEQRSAAPRSLVMPLWVAHARPSRKRGIPIAQGTSAAFGTAHYGRELSAWHGTNARLTTRGPMLKSTGGAAHAGHGVASTNNAPMQPTAHGRGSRMLGPHP